MPRRWLAVLILFGLLTACGAAPILTSTATIEPTLPPSPTEQPAIVEPTEVTSTPTPTSEPTPEPTEPALIGPDSYPPNVNPLTGLPVEDPSVLQRAPLLIMVSNESIEVRPQSGLSFADHVWEYQMEGFRQTRFTAVIYSESPERVGSVRSVRLINLDHLRPMYDGLLLISGASTGVYQHLQFDGYWDHVFREEQGRDALVRIRDVPRPNTDFYHGLFAVPANAWKYADERSVNTPPKLNGLAFSFAVPEGGTPITDAIIDSPEDGPIHHWSYDQTYNQWLSLTTDPRSMAAEAPDLDSINNYQLAFDNVIVLYVEYTLSDIIEDPGSNLSSPEVHLTGDGDAVLLRDGQRFNVKWHRNPEDMIRFTDEAENTIPLKPGHTWFEVCNTKNEKWVPTVTFEP